MRTNADITTILIEQVSLPSPMSAIFASAAAPTEAAIAASLPSKVSPPVKAVQCGADQNSASVEQSTTARIEVSDRTKGADRASRPRRTSRKASRLPSSPPASPVAYSTLLRKQWTLPA
jgi:hypothetical protein